MLVAQWFFAFTTRQIWRFLLMYKIDTISYLKLFSSTPGRQSYAGQPYPPRPWNAGWTAGGNGKAIQGGRLWDHVPRRQRRPGVPGVQLSLYAKKLCPVDTGRLRNSITFNVDESESSVSIGTNVEYGPYVELGTGKYTEGGRPTPWAYQDESGNTHWTAGNRAKPFLKPAVADHQQVYIRILNKECKGG